MRRCFKYILGVFLAISVLGSSIAPAFAAVTNQSLAVPLYTDPDKGSFWSDVRTAGNGAVPFVVANPSNGPGVAAKPVYTDALAKNEAAGMRTIGYVQTNFQARTFSDVYKDVDAWYRLYPGIKGIFVDAIKENSPADVCYVAALYSHIKNVRPNDLVILGGSHLSASYEPYGDIFVNAATDYASYQNWQVQHKGFEDKPEYQNRFWHLIYGVRADQYNAAFQASRNNNAGWVFITDQAAPSPYKVTPSFWQAEADDVGAVPPSAIPNRGKTYLPRGCISLAAPADHIIDTTSARQATSKTTLRVSNISPTYNTDAQTTVQVIGLPKGVSVTGLSSAGWTCVVADKSCTYGQVIPADSAAPARTVTLLANCDYSGGGATLRTTNYTGNRWETPVPVRPPFGCEASTPAGKANTARSGQVLSLTTQSTETTPSNTSESEQTPAPERLESQDASSRMPVWLGFLIAAGVIIVAGVAGFVLLRRRQRNRYSTRL